MLGRNHRSFNTFKKADSFFHFGKKSFFITLNPLFTSTKALRKKVASEKVSIQNSPCTYCSIRHAVVWYFAPAIHQNFMCSFTYIQNLICLMHAECTEFNVSSLHSVVYCTDVNGTKFSACVQRVLE